MSADTISVTNGGSVGRKRVGVSGPSPPASPQELQAALTVTSVGGVTYTSAGIKVGVLSTSFNRTGGAATDTADGALPPASQVTVLQDAPSDIVGTGADDEGRALMQAVHQIAPDASLMFYTADGSSRILPTAFWRCSKPAAT